MDAGGGGLGGGGGTVLNGDNNIMNANTITATGDINIEITQQITVTARSGTADLGTNISASSSPRRRAAFLPAAAAPRSRARRTSSSSRSGAAPTCSRAWTG